MQCVIGVIHQNGPRSGKTIGHYRHNGGRRFLVKKGTGGHIQLVVTKRYGRGVGLLTWGLYIPVTSNDIKGSSQESERRSESGKCPIKKFHQKKIFLYMDLSVSGSRIGEGTPTLQIIVKSVRNMSGGMPVGTQVPIQCITDWWTVTLK